jgi:hypothetical protein
MKGLIVLTVVVIKSSVFWGIKPYSPLKVNHVLEEHVTSIFRVELQAKEETSMKQAADKDKQS